MSSNKKPQSITVLNVGTKILLADVMDQYLRSIGDIKTHYASKLSVAFQILNDKKPDIVFCEYAFNEGGVIELIEKIGGLVASRDLYFVLAVEEMNENIVALAIEKGIDEVLVKPFSTTNLTEVVTRYKEKLENNKGDWINKLKEARLAFEGKRFQEAEALYTNCAKENLDSIPVLVEAAEFFIQQKNYTVANQICDRILNRIPDNVRALNISGIALKRMGRLKESADRFTTANKLSPANSVRHGELAETYLLMAEEEIQAALKSETENPQFIIMKARYQILRKDFAGAVVYLDAKQAFLTGPSKKEAEQIMGVAKKFGGIR